jgi:hypothetical protein
MSVCKSTVILLVCLSILVCLSVCLLSVCLSVYLSSVCLHVSLSILTLTSFLCKFFSFFIKGGHYKKSGMENTALSKKYKKVLT